jgi:ComF family protein
MAGLIRRVGCSLAKFASGGLNLLFPPRCAYCHTDLVESEDQLPLCPECCRKLIPEKWIGCRHCGAKIIEENDNSESCLFCKSPQLFFDNVVTIGDYRSGLNDVVLQMKHPQRESLTMAMGRLFAESRFSELTELRADLIIPIPMFWNRRLRRHTNSPDLLAHCLGKKLGIPLRPRLLKRCKNTRPQTEVSGKQRFSNVRGAFRARKSHYLKDARILLVDDVLTTGATGSEAARILKEAGAAMVAVAVVARAHGER